jgi:hypothetical protein
MMMVLAAQLSGLAQLSRLPLLPSAQQVPLAGYRLPARLKALLRQAQ